MFLFLHWILRILWNPNLSRAINFLYVFIINYSELI